MCRTLLPAALLTIPVALLALGCSSTETDSTEAPNGPDSDFAASADTGPNSATLQDPQDLVQQGRESADLREQKRQLIVQDLYERALQAFSDGRLSEAENYLIQAKEKDVANTQVNSLLEQVWLAQGKEITPLAGSVDDVRERLQSRLTKLRAEAEAHAERGFQLMGQGEYSDALGALKLARSHIEGISYQMDWGDLPERVNLAIEQAEANLEVEMAARRDEAKRQTYEQLKREEEQAKAQRRARQDRMFESAVSAFEDGDYDTSMELADSLLRMDPLNEQVSELRDATFRARHEAASTNFVQERRERFRRWVQENEEARILSSEIIQPTDPAYWANITARRAHYLELGLAGQVEPENLALMQEVSSVKVSGISFEGETSLEEVINQLRAQTDIPFVVTPDAIDAVDSEGIEYNLNLLHPVSVEDALDVIASSSGPDVTYTYRYGVVYLTTKEKAQGAMQVKAHDVQDLTAKPVDFSGPKIDEIRLPDSISSFDEEEPSFGGVVGEPRPIMDADNLETLITSTIDPDSWDEAKFDFNNGFLIVVHTPDVQRKIHAFLQDLRRYISSMVTIEARFLTIQKDFLQEIGVDFRGLGGTFSPPTSLVNLDDITSGLEDNASLGLDNEGPGLPDGAETNPSAGLYFDEGEDGDIRARTENLLGDYGDRLTPFGGMTMQFVFLDDAQTSMILRAVEKSNRAQELMSQTLSALNTQRAYVTVLNQITYVQDMDVEVAQAALIADPQVGVISDGIVLDVRPTIAHNRKYITLELQPTVATLLRPIPEFTSSLAGLTTPVTLQLPELQVSSAKTSVVIPDGGTVVIGGLKKLLNIEQRSEIPFLAKIPILSLLFKSEGEASEAQDVIILIRAHMTDAREVMAALENEQ
ncbi:MAG: hypothetical protein DWQ01_13890 [Planctomycetota bacterium]|nr:MAG: hypothetical protein DWQ01_13890 [Planctomycetota bacterium]